MKISVIMTDVSDHCIQSYHYIEFVLIHILVVVLRNSALLCGAMEKSTLGSGSKNNIFYCILREYNGNEAGIVMWRLARVASYFIGILY